MFTDLATLLFLHYSECFHSIPGLQKHGFSHENHVSKSIRTNDMLETHKCGKNWQPCWSYSIISVSILLLVLKNMGLAMKIMFLSQLEPMLCWKQVNVAKTGNPVVQIWQPCWSYTILSGSIQFLYIRNMGLARKIMFLSHLEPKLCKKLGNVVQNIWWITHIF